MRLGPLHVALHRLRPASPDDDLDDDDVDPDPWWRFGWTFTVKVERRYFIPNYAAALQSALWAQERRDRVRHGLSIFDWWGPRLPIADFLPSISVPRGGITFAQPSAPTPILLDPPSGITLDLSFVGRERPSRESIVASGGLCAPAPAFRATVATPDPVEMPRPGERTLDLLEPASRSLRRALADYLRRRHG